MDLLKIITTDIILYQWLIAISSFLSCSCEFFLSVLQRILKYAAKIRLFHFPGGWEEVLRSPGNVYWVKILPDEDFPIKLLFSFEIWPYWRTCSWKCLTLETWINEWVGSRLRRSWNTENLSRRAGIYYFTGKPTSWPPSDRTFVLFNAPPKEIDWFGQQAFLLVLKNAWRRSKPDGADSHVRATNGGNFYVAIPEETDPNAERCKVFGLTNNNYNGWLPKQRFSRIVTSKVPAAFDVLTKTWLRITRNTLNKTNIFRLQWTPSLYSLLTRWIIDKLQLYSAVHV